MPFAIPEEKRIDFNELFSVKDKVVLVTGGSRGIGEMIATGYVAGGAKVYISSRSVDACEKVSKELTARGPGQCFSLPADLQKLDDVKRLVAEITKREDHLDVLVNNAGANWAAAIEEYPDAAFQKVMNLNLVRIFSLTQAPPCSHHLPYPNAHSCLPLLTAKSSTSNPSSVINIGSIDGLRVTQHETYPYSASKAALHHLTRVMAGHLGPKGVTVNAIAPGAFQSKMMKETLEKLGDLIVARVPLARIGSPEDIAGTCIYLSSRAGNYTTGSVIVVDGGAISSAKL